MSRVETKDFIGVHRAQGLGHAGCFGFLWHLGASGVMVGRLPGNLLWCARSLKLGS